MSIHRAQIWFTDFVIGTMIFVFMLTAFLLYSDRFINQTEPADVISAAAQGISASLLQQGTPSDWNQESVESIGITNGNHVINRTKLLMFSSLSYNTSKRIFGISSEYFLYFENENGTAFNVEGICGIGNPFFSSVYNTSVAYYFNDINNANYKPTLENQFNADVFSAEPGYSTFANLVGNITRYDFVFFENPSLSAVEIAAHRVALEDFIQQAGKVMIIGKLSNAPGENLWGANFHEKATQTLADRNSTAKVNEPHFEFDEGSSLIFNTARYVENASASQWTEVQKFVSDNKIAIGYWHFGNGQVLFVSDASGNHSQVNYTESLERAIPLWGAFECNKIEAKNADYENLIQVERLLISQRKPVKMVLYLWR